jgi:hypothetical protein
MVIADKGIYMKVSFSPAAYIYSVTTTSERFTRRDIQVKAKYGKAILQNSKY